MLLVLFAIQGRTVFAFTRFLRFFLRFLSEVVIVFPCFLRFFLRFLSEVEGVFPHFLFFFFFGGGSFLEFFSVNIPRNQK